MSPINSARRGKQAKHTGESFRSGLDGPTWISGNILLLFLYINMIIKPSKFVSFYLGCFCSTPPQLASQIHPNGYSVCGCFFFFFLIKLDANQEKVYGIVTLVKWALCVIIIIF